MNQICPMPQCTGCSACANRCPKHCISMVEKTGLGHLYPQIDQTSCIDCGACKNVCPATHPVELHRPIKAYAGWDKDNYEYATSTSGGAASAFSRLIIHQGGVVYGCCVSGLEIKHIRVDNISDLYKLKGSKYVQSTINDCYRQVLCDLHHNRKVLFIGTPCQVAALKSFVRKESPNLYTIDLICHGVPSLSHLKRHIRKVSKGIIPDDIYFRKGSHLLLMLRKNGKEIYRNELFNQRYKDSYYNAFFDGFSYRDSCYHCRYATIERCSDITIGDFWGLQGELPLAHPMGCSVLLPLTNKGYELLSAISDDFYLFERTVEEAVQGNDQLRNPKSKNVRINMYRKLCPILGTEWAYKLSILDKKLWMYLKKLIKWK